MATTPFVCWCACVQLSVVVPLGGWISRRMAIILISTNYVCYQLTTQLAVTSLPVFLSRSLAPSVFLSAGGTHLILSLPLSAQLQIWAEQRADNNHTC